MSATLLVAGLGLVVYVLAGGRVGRAAWELPAQISAAGLGIASALLGAALLALVVRQLVFGLPESRISSSGIALGPHMIRWDDIEGAGEARYLGLSFIGIVVSRRTIAALPILDRLSAQRMKGNQLLITLSEAQLGTSLESALERIRALRPPSGTADGQSTT
ncbi:MAG TPA: hypothetical protein VEX41_02545 [Candidatus Eisenbacteria bacterium]|nr:hypothetical protein [Candidatus Eisenbacteria bacterium]